MLSLSVYFYFSLCAIRFLHVYINIFHDDLVICASREWCVFFLNRKMLVLTHCKKLEKEIFDHIITIDPNVTVSYKLQ